MKSAVASYFSWLASWLPLPFFHTQAFLVFFAIVFAVYWLTPKRWIKSRNLILIVASFQFYAAWSAELAFLVTGTATIDYLLAIGMSRARGDRLRKVLMITGIVMNLGILCYFKYANFFLAELNTALTRFGVSQSFDLLKVVVPFGISFYTFEAISYGVDVYRRKIQAETNLANFLLFILFFPHLVSGPIVRAGEFLPQVRRVKHFNWLRIQVGVQFFLLGVVKKLAIADRMAMFCDPVWNDPAKYSTTATWIAVIAYAFRIYFDFSGYSDMAVGTAHLLGFKLTQNFNLPYLATNVSEFWRRWHISLSTWLRDYLFIPLGGSRAGEWATCRNLMITMLLGGLWHGATWSFVLWGVLHGVFLIVHKWFQAFAKSRPALDRWLQTNAMTAVRIAVTFSCVTFAWIFFRKDLAGAMTIISQLVSIHNGLPSPMLNKALIVLLIAIAIGHTLVTTGWLKRLWAAATPEMQGIAYACGLLAAMLLSPDTSTSFVYFDF